MRLLVYVVVAAGLLVTAVSVSALTVYKNCSVKCTVVSDPATRPDINACSLFVDGVRTVDRAALVSNACSFDITQPLGTTRTYTARFSTAAEESTDSVPLVVQSEVLAPPTNPRLVP